VRRELEEELQTRLTDLFWRLSTDVLKILIQHKADVSEHREEGTVQRGTPPKPSSERESVLSASYLSVASSAPIAGVGAVVDHIYV
jgi:hypothetical protein